LLICARDGGARCYRIGETEEISRLKVDLDREVVAHSSREDVAQLRGKLEKKGSEMLKRDFELQ